MILPHVAPVSRVRTPLEVSGSHCDIVRYITSCSHRGTRHTMSVRKRTWTTRTGEAREAWIVDYADADGDRHIETFKRKKDADAYAQQTGVDVRAGTHTPVSKSITIAKAADEWIDYIT